MNDFFQPRFVDWNRTGFELFNFLGVVIDANDMMSDISETGACDQANVAGADD